jgi:hypothetical protein
MMLGNFSFRNTPKGIMVPYILVGVFLWIVTLVAMGSQSHRSWSLLCLIVIMAFTALRYEIGYDWLAYEQYFNWVGSSFSFSNYILTQSVLPVEYLYFILNVAISNIGGDFQILLISVAVFNLIVIDRMAYFIDPSSRPFVWLMYFCLALIMVQFNIIRQGVASSFVIIALMLASRQRYLGTTIALLAAFGFHTSIALYLPIFPFIHKKVKLNYIILALIISLIIFILGNAFFASALSAVGSILPGGFSAKTDGYASGIAGGNVWGISPLAFALILFYCFILYVFIRAPRDANVNIAILLTVSVLVAHIAFGQVPIVWNRIMCVSLPWQLATLWRYYVQQFNPQTRFFGVAVGGFAAILVISFQLTRPENVAFVPYHSLAQVWLFNDKGDGRVRSMYAVQQGQLEASQRALQ